MPPSGNLLASFKALIAYFNNAYNTKTYNGFQQYLYPTNHLIIQKVDDPGQFVPGDPAAIITYLTNDEANTGYFPQFNDGGSPNAVVSGNVGNVTPTAGTNGLYYDTYADFAIKKVILVQYAFRFIKYNGNWLLHTALLTPL